MRELWTPLTVAALVFAALALVFAAGFVHALRRRRWLGTTASLLLALLCLALAALAGAVHLGLRGYHALTHEAVAATITTERTGPRTFRTTVRFPDGATANFDLRGDELYVDARILKWHPWANLLGLHTAYRLDRIAGRYADVDDERSAPRTVYALGRDRPVDLFALAHRLPALRPLVDAEYGSATFVPAGERSAFELRVSTTGLLLRRAR